MKLILIVIVVLVLLCTVFALYLVLASNKSALQTYQDTRSDKELKICLYNQFHMTTITSSAKYYNELFMLELRKLASYIFGGNELNKHIIMKSIAFGDTDDSESTMSFVVPSMNKKDNMPNSNDVQVVVKSALVEHSTENQCSSLTSDANMNQKTEKSNQVLKSFSISYYGNFRYWGFNIPYQILAKKTITKHQIKTLSLSLHLRSKP